MCVITGTLAAIGAGVAAAASASSALISAQGQAASNKAQEQQSQQQAQIASQASKNSIDQGYLNAQRDYQAGDQHLAAQRAFMAANGVDTSSGSALDVQQSTARNTGLSVGTDQYEAGVQSTSSSNQAISYNNQARIARAGNASAWAGGALGATGAVAGGVSSLAGNSSFSSKWNDLFSSGSGGSSGPQVSVNNSNASLMPESYFQKV
ncbi:MULTISPECIES: hypothetical protein [unclassified Saccharibacter]|uniref:hypothetical protein n=1 Tax=unclassified Saccharibacter TaxID=2648722 RepID=UPI001322A440|nr:MULTISPECIES: hypothetical protein [unclassified Saccharibacter]MXV35872.1 hypothetical protein [Saccharibacter sp. EH611]MXV57992.1 hypothetical protein [Saccharibacter sp. EH70]MXV66387.1 hypothetical protein [Saccharibacter sp. EH60]